MTDVDLRRGDCLAVLAELPDNSVDAVVTDPPYGLGFMGKAWDAGLPELDVWAQCLRVLKPGGHLAAFGGTRTYHRLTCAIEDAGFEIRDGLAWLYGSGFPKGKTQLKPAHEPIVLARKPLAGTVAANVLAHGTGGLNIDGCRVGYHDEASRTITRNTALGVMNDDAWQPQTQTYESHAAGRWPANVVLAHPDTCTDEGGCVDGCPVAELDAQSGNRPGGWFPGRTARSPKFTGATYNSGEVYDGRRDDEPRSMGDSGGASRFFPTFRYQAKAPTRERPKIDGQSWPTVKPLALMAWLVRLITPPGGLVLDPFAGTGTTLQAARDEGFRALGIERDDLAYRLACQRLGLDGEAA